MSRITTDDGTEIYYNDWGSGRPIVFSHGWPLSADAFEGQMFFLAQLCHDVKTLAPLLSADNADLRKSNPKLRTYTMPGPVHTVLTRPDFYTAKVDDVALTKWLDDLVNGRKAGNVGDSLLVTGDAERLK